MRYPYEPWVEPKVGMVPSGHSFLEPRKAPPPEYRVRVSPVRGPQGQLGQGIWSRYTPEELGRGIVDVLVAVALGYHGFKRNRKSVKWGAVWAVGGLLCPIVVLPMAIYQGFGRPAA